MPSFWIRGEGYPLRELRWNGSEKSDQIAALMIYIALVHHANTESTVKMPDLGTCDLTYTEIANITNLSRAKVSGGLKILLQMGLIHKVSKGRNNIYQITNYGSVGGWAKLPFRGLYAKDFSRILAFDHFKLRTKNELNALKIYLVIISFRTNSTNYAQLSYDKISEYTGILRNDIRSAISLLVNINLVQVDIGNSEINKFSTVNLYRPCHLETYKHRGTVGIN